jgi:hypothetical protein
LNAQFSSLETQIKSTQAELRLARSNLERATTRNMLLEQQVNILLDCAYSDRNAVAICKARVRTRFGRPLQEDGRKMYSPAKAFRRSAHFSKQS